MCLSGIELCHAVRSPDITLTELFLLLISGFIQEPLDSPFNISKELKNKLKGNNKLGSCLQQNIT